MSEKVGSAPAGLLGKFGKGRRTGAAITTPRAERLAEWLMAGKVGGGKVRKRRYAVLDSRALTLEKDEPWLLVFCFVRRVDGDPT